MADNQNQAALINVGKLEGLKFLNSGKVRDIYEIDDDTLLFVTTDRLSAFDVVMKTGIPDKGKLLNQITTFWLNWVEKEGICKTHLITDNVDEMPEAVQKHKELLRGRSCLVKKLRMFPIESIIRGYITGSGWKDYGRTGQVCGIDLPKGLKHCQQLPAPLFTPSTKAEQGLHDENISEERAREILREVSKKAQARGEKYPDGDDAVDQIKALSIKIYQMAADHAKMKGIILADTKFEWGLDKEGNLVVADEILTPDSSRYWPGAEYEVGRNQNSFDKQIIRNWLEEIKFDKTNPIAIPQKISMATRGKYIEIFKILTGHAPVC